MRLLTGAVRSAGAVVALDLLLCVVVVAVRGAIFCVGMVERFALHYPGNSWFRSCLAVDCLGALYFVNAGGTLDAVCCIVGGGNRCAAKIENMLLDLIDQLSY